MASLGRSTRLFASPPLPALPAEAMQHHTIPHLQRPTAEGARARSLALSRVGVRACAYVTVFIAALPEEKSPRRLTQHFGSKMAAAQLPVSLSTYP